MQFFILPLLLGLGDAPAAQKPDIVVVCPAEFREAMQPWLAAREQQGHVVQMIGNQGSALAIRQQIRTIAKDGSLRYVVLVGDAPRRGPTMRDGHTVRRRFVCHRRSFGIGEAAPNS